MVLEPCSGVGGYVCLVPAYGIVLAYLASEDDHLVDSSGSLFAQELADDVVAERAGTDDGEVLVSRHVLLILGATRVLSPVFMRFLVPPSLRHLRGRPSISATLSSRLPSRSHKTERLALRKQPGDASARTRENCAM